VRRTNAEELRRIGGESGRWRDGLVGERREGESEGWLPLYIERGWGGSGVSRRVRSKQFCRNLPRVFLACAGAQSVLHSQPNAIQTWGKCRKVGTLESTVC